MHISLKFTGGQIAAMYAALTALAAIFVLFTEHFSGRPYYFLAGGRDTILSFYDASLFIVLALSMALTVISTLAYIRKKNERLFFVSFAFFLFSIKSALKIVDNHIIGFYNYVPISIQSLEALILLSLFFALFKK